MAKLVLYFPPSHTSPLSAVTSSKKPAMRKSQTDAPVSNDFSAPSQIDSVDLHFKLLTKLLYVLAEVPIIK